MIEIVNIIKDVGVSTFIIVILGFIAIKYIPKFLNVKLKRAEEKDYMLDVFNKTLENNTEVIKNNTEVMKNNSAVIKAYASTSKKLIKKINQLSDIVEGKKNNIKDSEEME